MAISINDVKEGQLWTHKQSGDTVLIERIDFPMVYWVSDDFGIHIMHLRDLVEVFTCGKLEAEKQFDSDLQSLLEEHKDIENLLKD